MLTYALLPLSDLHFRLSTPLSLSLLFLILFLSANSPSPHPPLARSVIFYFCLPTLSLSRLSLLPTALRFLTLFLCLPYWSFQLCISS